MEEKKIFAIQFGLDCLQMARDCLKDEQRKAILNVLEGIIVLFLCQLDMANLLEDMRIVHQYLLMSVHQLY